MMEAKRYYDIREDLESYPDAWCYLVWSKRGPGKTYSTLRYMVEENHCFVFLKRTKKDIDLLCASGKRTDIEFDVSPFKPLNRDFGWDIKPVKVHEGIAGFYHCNMDGEPYGSPIGYCTALSAASDIKGFDMSEADFLIFDEFIPKKHERISRGEGDALLDIYMTLRRDRILRGREDLKLVCLANAVSVNNPTFAILDVTDVAVDMDITRTETVYQDDRRVFLHLIDPEKYAHEEQKSGIEIAMAGTEWAEMAFSGHFAYDDFTSVKRQRLKGFHPICSYEYKKKTVYIYEKDGKYAASKSPAKVKDHFNLARENEQKRFWYEYVADLRDECINDCMTFENFTMYDTIMNYKKIFEVA